MGRFFARNVSYGVAKRKPSRLHEVGQILQEIGHHETLYEYAHREPEKAQLIVDWLMHSVLSDPLVDSAFKPMTRH